MDYLPKEIDVTYRHMLPLLTNHATTFTTCMGNHDVSKTNHSARWLAYPNRAHSHFLINLGVCRILFIAKVEILCVIKRPYRFPCLCWLLHLENQQILKTLAISFQLVGFGYPFLDPHPTMWHSNVGDPCNIMLLFFSRYQYLLVCGSTRMEEQSPKDICAKYIEQRLQIQWINPDSIVNTVGRSYVVI